MSTGEETTASEWICRAVERAASEFASFPAVTDAKRVMSYEELWGRSERLGDVLAERAVGPGHVVAYVGGRNCEMAVALLATWRASATYLPIDSALPSPIVGRQLDAVTPAAVIDSEETISFASPRDREGQGKTRARGSYRTGAYIIFTSGSTGISKGVIVSHRAIASTATSLRKHYEISQSDKCLQFSSISWDTSLEELLPPFLSGATVVLRPNGVIPSIDSFLRFCNEQRISILNLPTSFWLTIHRAGLALPGCVRLLIVGGEPLPAQPVRDWLGRQPRHRFINTYGLTEAAAVSVLGDLQEVEDLDRMTFAPIGTPLPGVVASIRNDDLITPASDTGQLVLTGPTLADGYLNSANEPGFFQSPKGERAFATGDLATRDERGRLFVLGRLDSQVMLRGYRVSAEEIESALIQVPGVEEAGVVPVDTSLVALITTQTGHDAIKLRGLLARDTPEYLLPSRIDIVDRLPRLYSGKLDRTELSKLAEATVQAKDSDFEGTGAQALIDAFIAVVGHAPNLDLSFVEAGGDSLAALLLLAKLGDVAPTRLTVVDLLSARPLRDIAQELT
jgi:amino acid adenylation domain-containing protein